MRPRSFLATVWLAALGLLPLGPLAAQSLPPAPFRALPHGTSLNYGRWTCDIIVVDGFEHTCAGTGGSVQIFAGLLPFGNPAGPAHIGSLRRIHCTHARRGSVQRRGVTLTLPDDAESQARSLWPLTVGNKAKFVLRGPNGEKRFWINFTVAGAEKFDWYGKQRDVYRITANAVYGCRNLNRANFQPEDAELKMTWWYDPGQGVVLKHSRNWTAAVITEEFVLGAVTFPTTGALAEATPPRVAPKPAPAPKSTPATAAKPATAPAPSDSAFELAFWNAIKDTRSADDYKAYLEQFPNGRFAALARVRARPPAPPRSAQRAAAAPRPDNQPNPFADLHFGPYSALVIGNNAYSHLPPLKTAVNDAQSVAQTLERDYGFNVELLVDATRGDILRAFARLRARLVFDDNLLVYYAGHGLLDEIGQQGYWLPVDAEDGIPTNWISTGDITVMLRAIQAKHVMVVADSCYSGTLVRAAAAAPRTATAKRAWIKRILKKRARIALVSGGLEPVADAGGGGHSVFANAFLAALADNDGVIEGQTLFDRIKRPVVLNADQTPQYSDIRKAGHEGGDFLFVRRN